MFTVTHVAGDMARHQDHGDIQHRHVDALAQTGAFALEQGGGEGVGAHRAGRVIDRRGANFDRVGVRRAGHRHDAGRGLDHMVIGGAFAFGAALTESGE